MTQEAAADGSAMSHQQQQPNQRLHLKLPQAQQHKLAHLLSSEIRLIEASKLTKLSAIIDKARGWNRLLEELTRPQLNATGGLAAPAPLELSLDAINLIEQQPLCGNSPTLALLNHWSITGRRRPTVKTLLNYLHRCQLKWAEEFVCQSVLGLSSIEQLIAPAPQVAIEHQPAQPSENQDQQRPIEGCPVDYKIGDEFKFSNLDDLVGDLVNCSVRRFPFETIYSSSCGFCHEPHNFLTKTGIKLGEGRFSSVFRAVIGDSDSVGTQYVAAKLLKSECNLNYLANEIDLISTVKHESILELLGISLGGGQQQAASSKNGGDNGNPSYICLVYPYMENGSLLDCLKSGLPSKAMEPISWRTRVDIVVKVARGIQYLHSFRDSPLIHRDIKTANIFINANEEPKIGDFTLLRRLDPKRLAANETQYSQNVIGTSVYMPPEAFRGDISCKFDTFSFGIVLLELLTGKRPFIEDLDEDLLTHLRDKLWDIADEFTVGTDSSSANLSSSSSSASLSSSRRREIELAQNKFLLSILDGRAGLWDHQIASSLYRVSLECTESRKNNRPLMDEVLTKLESVTQSIA